MHSGLNAAHLPGEIQIIKYTAQVQDVYLSVKKLIKKLGLHLNYVTLLALLPL
jgi:hypothetical protein